MVAVADTLLNLLSLIINYNRKSRQDEELEKRTGEDTLKSMRELMERTLNPLGIPYVQRDEIGSGDKISSRPVFQEILEDLSNNKYQAIAVKEISRMGRGSYTDMGVIYDLIVEKRIFIITPYRIYDPKNPADLRQIRFELFMSREEFETTSERLAGGRATSAMSGKWVAGAPPFGFVLNKDTKRLMIHDEETKIVNTIFQYFVFGIPAENGKKRLVRFRALSSFLETIGIHGWDPERLERLITNPAYVGIVAYNTTMTVDGKVIPRPREDHIYVPWAHPIAVPIDVWIEAQKLAEDKSYQPRTRSDLRPHELTGLIVCAKCKRRMVRQQQLQKYISRETGETKKYYKEFVICTSRRCTMVKYRDVEESLLDVLKIISNLNDKQIHETMNRLVEREKHAEPAEDPQQFIDRRMKELKARLDFIYEKYETGIYTDEMFLERKSEIDRELEKLSTTQTHMKKNKKNVAQSYDAERIRKNSASFLQAYLSETDRVAKNTILRTVFTTVDLELIERGRGSIPAKFNIYPKLKHTFVTRDYL